MSGPAQLLADCEARGVRLLPAGDGGLTIDAPEAALTDDLLARLKVYKGELLAILKPVAAPALESPGTVFDSAKLIANEGVSPLGGVVADARAPAPAAVCRCGATWFRDVRIHCGQSIRRDCGGCGRFIDFPTWYGK